MKEPTGKEAMKQMGIQMAFAQMDKGICGTLGRVPAMDFRVITLNTHGPGTSDVTRIAIAAEPESEALALLFAGSLERAWLSCGSPKPGEGNVEQIISTTAKNFWQLIEASMKLFELIKELKKS